MLKIKIDNKEYSVKDGSYLIEAIRSAGHPVPTLCYRDGIEHYSSCMVCMVKDIKKSSYIPSCSALVQDGMEIDVSGTDVKNLRSKALELLFSEHRAECEAPCRIVCPAGYNIPEFNRLIASGDTELARQITVEELSGKSIMCVRCPGYCENGCRRKNVDQPVAIRNMKLFVAASIEGAIPDPSDPVMNEALPKTGRSGRRFSSLAGKLEPGEQEEWLKECVGNIKRSREISDFIVAAGEAASCMHCDCRAAGDCRLRDLAEEFGIRDPRGKLIYSPIRKKINFQTGLVFENAKCIKCGLCVRVCEDDDKEEPRLCFLNRGFVSIISEPLTGSFDDILQKQADKVIEVCPTGALSRFKQIKS
jgi:predicted molibdopterin-dependent oxidoreductase YjgC